MLTLDDGNMDGGIVSNLLGRHIMEKGRQISSRMLLKEEVETEGVVNAYTVPQKVLINILCGIMLRDSSVLAPPYGVCNIADYRRSVQQPQTLIRDDGAHTWRWRCG